jgi:hypothetical protein
MISKTEVWKEIRPELPDYLDDSERTDLMNEIGDYVLTSMLDLLADGQSPVEGVGDLSKLTTKYADAEKDGDRTPNMELGGDLLDSLKYEADAYAVKIGTWEEGQAIKAYGHITGFKGHKWLDGKVAPRKILPSDKERFVQDIQDGIDTIIEEFASSVIDKDNTG